MLALVEGTNDHYSIMSGIVKARTLNIVVAKYVGKLSVVQCSVRQTASFGLEVDAEYDLLRSSSLVHDRIDATDKTTVLVSVATPQAPECKVGERLKTFMLLEQQVNLSKWWFTVCRIP